MKRLFILSSKEFIHLRRDKRALILALLVPLFLTILFGYVLSLDVKGITIGVCNKASTPESRKLTEVLKTFDGWEVVKILPEREYIHYFQKSRLTAVIEIPKGWPFNPDAIPTLEVDGRDPVKARVLVRDIENLLNELRRKKIDRITPHIAFHILYNPELKSQMFIVPGLMALILLLITALLPSITVAREYELGTLEQLWIAPYKRYEIFIGKLFPYFLLGYLQITLILVSVVIFFSIPIRGSLLELYIVSTLFIFVGAGIGVTLSSIARNQQAAMQFTWLITFLPSFFLSGFIFPIESMPKLLQWISLFVPARYFLKAIRAILLKGAGISELQTDIIDLLLFNMVLFLLAVRSLRRGVV
jgi:ABC-2 type transport system permease protein